MIVRRSLLTSLTNRGSTPPSHGRDHRPGLNQFAPVTYAYCRWSNLAKVQGVKG